jgi:RTX calcium-binding nonapeptide repeat (4 copies)
VRRPAPALTLLTLLVCPGAAQAATVNVENRTLRVIAAPGELNQITITPAPSDPAALEVTDGIASPVMVSDATSVYADLGDGDDVLSLTAPVPAQILGGEDNDTLTVAPATLAVDPALSPAVTLDGGDGDDTLTGAGGADTLLGFEGDDRLTGGYGNDTLDAAGGSDTADGGAGADRLVLLDELTDTAWCGTGRDRVRAEELDQLDFACERVDYGPPGRVGRLRARTGRGKFVVIPGMPWARIDRRLLPNLLWMVRRYHVRVGDGYAPTGHAPLGEHPLGLAVDLTPGPGGTWRDVGRLARWAEPRQNRPRPPFRWVGWNGDKDHGHPRVCKPWRGCPPHLHLSWAHSPGRPRRPVRTVWTFDVSTAKLARGALMGPPAGFAAQAPLPDL